MLAGDILPRKRIESPTSQQARLWLTDALDLRETSDCHAPSHAANSFLQKSRRGTDRLCDLWERPAAYLGAALGTPSQFRLGQSNLAPVALAVIATPHTHPLRLARMRSLRPRSTRFFF